MNRYRQMTMTDLHREALDARLACRWIEAAKMYEVLIERSFEPFAKVYYRDKLDECRAAVASHRKCA